MWFSFACLSVPDNQATLENWLGCSDAEVCNRAFERFF
jgi:hypothetical protein